MAKKNSSIEPEVESRANRLLAENGVKCTDKNKSINNDIENALATALSKQGGKGGNKPDIQFLAEIGYKRLPVMIEAKGTKGKLLKVGADGTIEQVNEKKDGTLSFNTVNGYAVNGAVHYAKAIINYTKTWKDCLAVGINGYDDATGRHFEEAIYYVSEDNLNAPIFISKDMKLLYTQNWTKLFQMVENAKLSDEEREAIVRKAEENLEVKIKKMHQCIYDDEVLKTLLTTNEKLYLFCGLIMAGLKTKDVAPLEESDFKGNKKEDKNDGTVITDQIKVFLSEKKCSADKVDMICGLLNSVFTKKKLWMPTNGESILKKLFREVHDEIIPCFEGNLHLDFTGKILNSLNDWVSIDNDAENDVVLTPRYVTKLMAKLARTGRDSFVWDKAMGSAGFLISAMDIMIKDAKDNIIDAKELADKIKHIKEQQLLGIEILGNIYILAVLNMILMGDGSSNILNGNSHDKEFTLDNLSKDFEDGFPASVFLLNPPYSADGKGFNFVEEALSQMTRGYAAILIQDSAGNGQGLPYTKRILENNTLEASIRMPSGLFGNKATVNVYIFVFKVHRAHEEDDMVTFIDFSEDGYSRQNRKKSSQEVNLRNTDHAIERYAEVEAIVLGKKPQTNYYTTENGLVVRDSISLNGDDWLFTQHQKVDSKPIESDFKNTVAEYFSWKISQFMKGSV